MERARIKKGDQVEILPAFQDAGDDQLTWIALGDEEKGRVDIAAHNLKMRLKPNYTIAASSLKVVGQSEEPSKAKASTFRNS